MACHGALWMWIEMAYEGGGCEWMIGGWGQA